MTWDKDVKFLTASNHDGQQGEYHHNIISGKWIWHEEERLPKREPVTIEAIEAKAAELMALFEQVPAARYRALAITSLELAVIWIGKELKQ